MESSESNPRLHFNQVERCSLAHIKSGNMSDSSLYLFHFQLFPGSMVSVQLDGLYESVLGLLRELLLGAQAH